MVYDNMYSKPPLSNNNTKSIKIKFYIEDDPVRLLSGKICGEVVGYFDYECSVWVRDGAPYDEKDDEVLKEYWMSDKMISWWQHLDEFEEKSLNTHIRRKKANAGFV